MPKSPFLADEVFLGQLCRQWLSEHPHARPEWRRVAAERASVATMVEDLVDRVTGDRNTATEVGGRACHRCGRPAERGRRVCGSCRGKAQRERARAAESTRRADTKAAA
jgi:hypothetical protein